MMSDSDSNTGPLALLNSLADQGDDVFTDAKNQNDTEFAKGLTVIAALNRKGDLPLEVRNAIVHFGDESVRAQLENRPLPSLGSSGSVQSNPLPVGSTNPAIAGEEMTDDEVGLVLAYRVRNFEFDSNTGQIKGFEKIAQITDTLQRLEAKLGLGVGGNDTILTRTKAIEAEVDKIKSASAGGKGVNTSEAALAAGLKAGATMAEITDKIRELAKRPDAQVDTSPIAKALGQKDDATIDDLAKAAELAHGWQVAGAAVEKFAVTKLGRKRDKESHETFVKEAIDKGGFFGRSGGKHSGGKGQ